MRLGFESLASARIFTTRFLLLSVSFLLLCLCDALGPDGLAGWFVGLARARRGGTPARVHEVLSY
jgi:hypothetical protein